MTNPGDSDEWWKQYGGEGVSPDSGASSSVPQYPTSGPSGYPSAPQYPQQPPQYQQPQYQPPQPQYPQSSGPSYPQQPGYGYPQAGGYQPYGAPPSGGLNGMALASMIVSIAGVASCCFIVPSIVGLVLGVVAMNQMKTSGDYNGKGMAQAGIWVGAAGAVLGIVYWVLNIAIGFSAGM
ncbi:DUF4190 domain-containing protein [Nocardia farcinica]|uniref:DUF4190 domain-containing protein n=2 Tax=Nocardia farcinica TaxID=37329 RepID=Q5Z382_NOCFA|nr:MULTISPECIES: DUF4190 domain-containing protein [Nocardia]MBA4855794.1 DUF4190 domain-containing protein [Nocardia farcinica]MBC9815760.1 DUF4190 domain-containing protein [Nocardia farcinica]MBF6071847.1 DUF4190 domain-containing protein [Nocardia farcinica]MBF6188378.1 DUF4190 domain-containing protein [Nocardia farcinica]MBF6233449.1 DUF4190 domain-containing protein [Nocardia farcinica]